MSGDENPLARDIERAVRAAKAAVSRVTEVEGGLDAVAARVGEVEQMLGGLAQDVAAVVDQNRPVRSWILAQDAEQARADLVDLAAWIERVYLRYLDTRLPACWAWHPAVVEELLMLRHLHAAAYHGRSWDKVGDWHDRWLPGVRERIRRDVGTCELDLHKKAKPAAVTPMVQHLDDVVDAWMSTGLPPVPTQDQLRDAREHDSAGHGGWRDVSA